MCCLKQITKIHNFLHNFFFQNYETHLMKRDSSHCGSGDPLAPFGNALKSFFVFKLFLILSFLISLVTLAVTLINAIQQNRCEIFGCFFSSHFLKMREKCISFAQLVLLSLYIFWGSVFTFQFLNYKIHKYVKKT